MTTFVSEITTAATSHVLNTLSTLYTSPVFAVMREFVANGIDAHADAGHTGPVEVTLPDVNSLRVVIRDHGNGMSRDTLINTYYNYGESTKRGDNSRIGAFGLGSKSAYALSPTWELSSVTTTSIVRVVSCINDQGMPEHSLDETPNDGAVPTGVTVSIPIGDTTSIRQFHEESAKLSHWLPKGSVHVTNARPVYGRVAEAEHWTDRTVRRGALAYPLSFRSHDAQVVMAGVPYRAELKEVYERAADTFRTNTDQKLNTVYGRIPADALRNALTEARAVVVLEDAKSVDVTTSRDDIKMTQRSLEVLTTVFAQALDEAVTFLTGADGSLEYLERGRDIPLVGILMHEMRGSRTLDTNPTAMFPYTRRKGPNHAPTTDFHLYQNLLWRKYPYPNALVITEYPETMPTLQLLDRVVLRDLKTTREDIYVTHGPDTGRAALDAGRDVLSRHGVTFMSWEEYRNRVTEIRRADRAAAGAPATVPVEGVILRDHKVVRRFSVELGKFSKVIESADGAPLYFTNMWSGDDDDFAKRLPRGFTGVLVRSLMDKRRDNLLAARHGVLPSAELNKLTVNENNIAAVRALPAKQRRAVLDHLDIESRSGVDYVAVKEVYEHSIRMGNVLAGSHFTKAVESCEIGRRILSSRDSGLRRYSMDSGAILSALRKDSDRFYTRYPLLTIVNLSRSSAHKDALDALVQYIKSVESA